LQIGFILSGNYHQMPPGGMSAMKKNFISDRGGTRSGNDRRKNNSIYLKVDRRTGRDRRSGNDRRQGSIYHHGIERRDINRGKKQDKS